VHHNIFRLTAQIATPTGGTHSPHGCDHERTNEDIIVEHNRFTNYPAAINLTLASSDYHYDRIHYRYNIFENCGYSDGGYVYGAIQFVGNVLATGELCNNIYIENNVFHANLGRGLIMLQQPYDMDSIYIRNNIFLNAAVAGWLVCWDVVGVSETPTGDLSNFFVYNNLMYNNAGTNAIYYRNGKSITNLFGYSPQTNILGSNPLFKSNETWRLRPTSPAIDAGIDVGLTHDYWGHKIVDTPDIGACEAGNYILFY
jgi:hypothetical protein